jgi:hypothetical protein
MEKLFLTTDGGFIIHMVKYGQLKASFNRSRIQSVNRVKLNYLLLTCCTNDGHVTQS